MRIDRSLSSRDILRTFEGQTHFAPRSCRSKKYMKGKRQYFEGREVPLVHPGRYYAVGNHMHVNRTVARAYEFTEKKYESLFELWRKKTDRREILGENFLCLTDLENESQLASEGYGCIATIKGMDFPGTYFYCGFQCGAEFSLSNGLSFRLNLSRNPDFLKNAGTIKQAVKAWEDYLLKYKEAILNKIIERDDRFKVVQE